MDLQINKLIIGASANYSGIPTKKEIKKYFPDADKDQIEYFQGNHQEFWIEANKIKAQGYRDNGQQVWNKLWRIRDFSFEYEGQRITLDQLKTLMPSDPFNGSYGYAPMALETALPAKLLGMDVVVVGGSELEQTVNDLNSFLMQRRLLPDQLPIRYQAEAEIPSLAGTLDRGIKALGLEENEDFFFVNGDIPGFDLISAVTNPEVFEHDFYINLCGKDVIYEDGVFLPRNWYQAATQGFKRPTLVKEPTFFKFKNVKLFTDLIGLFYDRDRVDGVVSNNGFWQNEFKDFIKKNGLAHHLLNPNIYLAVIPLVVPKQLGKLIGKEIPGLYFQDFTSLAFSQLSGYDIRITAQHSDPIQAADNDAWQDWRDKMNWMHAARYGNPELGIKDVPDLSETFWYGKVWTDFQEYLHEIGGDRSQLMQHFIPYANHMAEQYGLEPFFDSKGKYQFIPQAGRDYKGLVDHLRSRTKNDIEIVEQIQNSQGKG